MFFFFKLTLTELSSFINLLMNEPGTLDACYARFSIFSAQVLMTLKKPHVLKTIKVLYIFISFLSPSLVVVPLITL